MIYDVSLLGHCDLYFTVQLNCHICGYILEALKIILRITVYHFAAIVYIKLALVKLPQVALYCLLTNLLIYISIDAAYMERGIAAH